MTNAGGTPRPDRVTRGTYVGVFVVELLVLAAIWILQRSFAGP